MHMCSLTHTSQFTPLPSMPFVQMSPNPPSPPPPKPPPPPSQSPSPTPGPDTGIDQATFDQAWGELTSGLPWSS